MARSYMAGAIGPAAFPVSAGKVDVPLKITWTVQDSVLEVSDRSVGLLQRQGNHAATDVKGILGLGVERQAGGGGKVGPGVVVLAFLCVDQGAEQERGEIPAVTDTQVQFITGSDMSRN